MIGALLSRLVVDIAPLIVKTAIGKNVTKEADRKGLTVLGRGDTSVSAKLTAWKRPLWLRRRMIAATLVVLAAAIGGIWGIDIPEGDVKALTVALDNAVPVGMALWAAVLGIIGHVKRDK